MLLGLPSLTNRQQTVTVNLLFIQMKNPTMLFFTFCCIPDLNWKLFHTFFPDANWNLSAVLPRPHYNRLTSNNYVLPFIEHFPHATDSANSFIISSSLQPLKTLLLFSATWDVWGLEMFSYPRSFIQWHIQLVRGWNQIQTRCFWTQGLCYYFLLDCNYQIKGS